MAMTFLNNRFAAIGTWTNYSPVSVCMWFKINTSKNPNRLFGSDDLWEIRVTQDWSGGSYRFANELFGSTTGTPPISTTVIASGTWYHAVATATSGGTAGVFINGVSESSASCVDVPSGTTLSIGNRNGAAAGDGLNGVLDDVRVYDRILTASEILTIYASRGSDDILNGLKNRWMMDEGAEGTTASGTGVIKDLMGRNNGTPASSPTYAGSFCQYIDPINR